MFAIYLIVAMIATWVFHKLGLDPPTENDYLILAVLLVGDVIFWKNERGKREK